MDSLQDIWEKYQKWCRLVILLHEGGETICKDILYKMGIADLSNGAEIYQKLETHKEKIKKMAFYQQKILLPYGKVIDTSKLDVSLQTHIIRILDTTKNYPLIGKLRDHRNELFHMSECRRDMTERQFKKYWDQISELLTAHCFDVNKLNYLKTDNHLNRTHEKRFKDILHHVKAETEMLHEHMDVEAEMLHEHMDVEAEMLHEHMDVAANKLHDHVELLLEHLPRKKCDAKKGIRHKNLRRVANYTVSMRCIIVLLIIALLASTLSTMSVFILNRRDNATSNSLKTKDSKTGTNATSNLIKNTESEIARKACSHSTRNLHSKKRRFNGKIHENGEECKSMINKAMESFFKELALGLGYSYLFHDLNWLTCVFMGYKEENSYEYPNFSWLVRISPDSKLLANFYESNKGFQALYGYTEIFNEFLPSLKNVNSSLKYFDIDQKSEVERKLERVTRDWQRIKFGMVQLMQDYKKCFPSLSNDFKSDIPSKVIVPYNDRVVSALVKKISKEEIAASIFQQMLMIRIVTILDFYRHTKSVFF